MPPDYLGRVNVIYDDRRKPIFFVSGTNPGRPPDDIDSYYSECWTRRSVFDDTLSYFVVGTDGGSALPDRYLSDDFSSRTMSSPYLERSFYTGGNWYPVPPVNNSWWNPERHSTSRLRSEPPVTTERPRSESYTFHFDPHFDRGLHARPINKPHYYAPISHLFGIHAGISFFPSSKLTVQMKPSKRVCIYVDGSPTRVGFIFMPHEGPSQWLAWTFTKRQRDIVLVELYAFYLGICTLIYAGYCWEQIAIHSDQEHVVKSMKLGRWFSRNLTAMRKYNPVLRDILSLCVRYGLRLDIKWVPSRLNPADVCSRDLRKSSASLKRKRSLDSYLTEPFELDSGRLTKCIRLRDGRWATRPTRYPYNQHMFPAMYPPLPPLVGVAVPVLV